MAQHHIGRELAGALAGWVGAVHAGDPAGAERCRREAERLGRALAADPVLGPAVAAHLGPDGPRCAVGAVACAVALMEAHAAAAAAAPNN